MTSAISTSTYGMLDRLLASNTTLNSQISNLQQQVTTGKVAQSYAGLAASSSQVLSLSAATSALSTYTTAIATAQGKASVIQDAYTQIASLVSTVAASALGLTGTTSPSDVASVAQQAKAAFQQVAALLNTTYAGDYVFGGADTSKPPVPSSDSVTSSGLYTQIGAQVAQLATTPTNPAVAQVIANTVAIASSTAAGTTIFSSYLTGAGATAAATTIQIGDSQKVSLDLPANKNTGATSNPAINGTGSAIGDILRSLATVANGASASSANPDFATLMKDAAATLSSAGVTLAQQAGEVGQTQTTLTAAAASHAAVGIILQKQLTGLTDVDQATAISQLQAVSNQLEVSYKVLSLARSLTLASYL